MPICVCLLIPQVAAAAAAALPGAAAAWLLFAEVDPPPINPEIKQMHEDRGMTSYTIYT
jgi:hypothetical protein